MSRTRQTLETVTLFLRAVAIQSECMLESQSSQVKADVKTVMHHGPLYHRCGGQRHTDSTGPARVALPPDFSHYDCIDFVLFFNGSLEIAKYFIVEGDKPILNKMLWGQNFASYL